MQYPNPLKNDRLDLNKIGTKLRHWARPFMSLRDFIFLVLIMVVFFTSRLLILDINTTRLVMDDPSSRQSKNVRLKDDSQEQLKYIITATGTTIEEKDSPTESINLLIKNALKQQQIHVAESYPRHINGDGDLMIESRIVVQKDGRYVLSNVFIQNDRVYFVSNDPNITFQPLICSSTESPFFVQTKYCKIQVLSPTQLLTQVNAKMEIKQDNILDNAIIIAGLNPFNSYHIVWEGVIPAYSMLLEDGDLPRDPAQAVQYFQDNNWSIFWTDLESSTSKMNSDWWRELLPTVRNAARSYSYYKRYYYHDLFFARRLIIGTRGNCPHYTHCPSGGTFDPVDSAIAFRNFIAHTHNFTNAKTYTNNITNSAQQMIGTTSANRKTSICRITVVQRSSTRKILNFDAWVKSIKKNDSLGPREVREVDFENLSLQEQMSITSNTDIFILIHGGALVHVTWLPPGALVVDIHPYGSYNYFPPGLVNWMRFSLRELQLGYHRIRINYTDGQYINNKPMATDCFCYKFSCHHDVFVYLTGITIDIPMFSNEILQAVEKWRHQKYEEPLPMEAQLEIENLEKEIRESAFEEEKKERMAKGLPQRPSCI